MAVMLVLNPMVTTNAGEIMNQVEVAQEQTQSDGTIVMQPKNPQKPLTYKETTKMWTEAKTIGETEFKNASNLYGDCKIEYLSTDGNDEDPERVRLRFDKKVREDLWTSAHLSPHRLVIDKNGHSIQGYGIKMQQYDGVFHVQQKKVSVPVTQEFFEFMYAVLKDDVPVIINSKKEIPIDF